MKKILLALFVCIGAITANAALIKNDFMAGYSVGDNIEIAVYDTTTATIMKDQWNLTGRFTPLSSYRGGVSPVAVAPLTYTGYPESAVDCAMQLLRLSNSDVRNTVYSLANTNTYSTGAYYFAMLVKVEEVSSTSGQDFFSLDGQYASNNLRSRIFLKNGSTSDKFVFGLSDNVSTPTVSTEDYDKGETFLVVLKYDFTNLQLSLFINPATDGVEGTPTISTLITSKLTSIRGLVARQRTAYKAQIGNFRMADAWVDAVPQYVTGLTKLAAPTANAATNVMAESFTANWSEVPDATGYIVNIYEGANLVGAYNADATATSLSIRGLWVSTAYTYTVTAKGDGVANDNSDESADVTFTTTETNLTSIHTNFADGTWGDVATSLIYTPNYINGFDLTSAIVYTGTTRGAKGETHVNRIALEKVAGKVILPIIKSVKQIELHITAGSAGNGLTLSEYNKSEKTWSQIGTYTYGEYSKSLGLDTIFVIDLDRDVPTKLKVENLTNGVAQLVQVIVRDALPTQVELDAPVILPISNRTETAFTANWETVPNAIGYKLSLFKDGVYNKSYDLDGTGAAKSTTASAISFPVTGLTPNTYTYIVSATADGVSYSNSYFSPMSESINMSAPVSINENAADRGNVVSTKYFNLSGVEVKGTIKGQIYIQKDWYENGSFEITKVIK